LLFGINIGGYATHINQPHIRTLPEFQSNNFLNASTSGTYSAIALSSIGSVFYDTQKHKPTFVSIMGDYSTQKPIERKDEIEDKLNEINSTLKQNFNTAWQAFLDQSKERDISIPSHLMREVLSHLLHILAPDEKVKSRDWCELDDKRNPTQKSRVRFAIFGNREHNENDFFFEPVKNLMDEERDLYKELNKYAHYREEKLPEDYREKLEIYLATLQSLIGEILDMRDKYYKK